MYYSATQLSNRTQIPRLEVNPRLEELGLCTRDEKGVVIPTEEGLKYCKVVRKHNPVKKVDYDMCTWSDKVLEMLGYAMPPSREKFDELRAAHDLLEQEFRALVSEVKDLKGRLGLGE